MGLSSQQSVQLYGSDRYTGWGETEAAADAKSKGIAAPMPGSFNFDYEAEAKKAYGDLGEYYDRILKESKGDVNLALSRMKEDYERGARIRKEDLTANLSDADRAEQEAQRQNKLQRSGVVDNALARGLYQKSAFDPNTQPTEELTGFGIPQTNMGNVIAGQQYDTQGRAIARNRLLLGDTRASEQADLGYSRGTVDINRAQTRFEAEQERQRRLEAAQLAETRGNRALSKWQASISMV